MPDTYHIIISPRAVRELTEICSYIRGESPSNAALVATRLVASIDSLEQLPHRYEVHQHRKDPRKTVHSMAVPPFIIYYRIDDNARAVRILSVRHGARRQPQTFK
jgi:plasmid stabilization system protein ParE